MQLIMESETIVGVNKIDSMDTESMIKEKLTNGVTEEISNGTDAEEKPEKVVCDAVSDTKIETTKPCENGDGEGDGATKINHTENSDKDVESDVQNEAKPGEDCEKVTDTIELTPETPNNIDNSEDETQKSTNDTEEKIEMHDDSVDGKQNDVVMTEENKNENNSEINSVDAGKINIEGAVDINITNNVEDIPKKDEEINDINESLQENNDISDKQNVVLNGNDLKNSQMIETKEVANSEEKESDKDCSLNNGEIDVTESSNIQEEDNAPLETVLSEENENAFIVPSVITSPNLNEPEVEKDVMNVEEVSETVKSNEKSNEMDIDTVNELINETIDNGETQSDEVEENVEVSEKPMANTESMEVDGVTTEKAVETNIIPDTETDKISCSMDVDVVAIKLTDTESKTEATNDAQKAEDKINSLLDNTEKHSNVKSETIHEVINEPIESVKDTDASLIETISKEKLTTDTEVVPSNKIEASASDAISQTLAQEKPKTNENDSEIIDCDDDKETNTDYSEKTNDVINIDKSSKEELKAEKPKNSFCLANTLDILSDDDEDVKKDEKLKKDELKKATDDKCIDLDDDKDTPELVDQSKDTKVTDNKCINLDDDDDVMLIDEDTPKESEKESKNLSETKTEGDKPENKIEFTESEKAENDTAKPVEVLSDSEKDVSAPIINEKPVESKKAASPKPVKKVDPAKSLVPENFLKKFKTNVADMTRDELEEFCLLKIVEGVIDRSNLSDTAIKLKAMAQNVEEWKKKAMMLTKQNRDLQLVVMTVQEEQKKRAEGICVPLKITRSVGMQVVMTDSTSEKMVNRRKSVQQVTPPASRAGRIYPQRNAAKNNNTPPQIPVPRLVPATANSPLKATRQATQPNKVPAPAMLKNSPPVAKAEKRPYNSVQSVTVDLTDDEPAPKQLAAAPRNQQNLRLVSPQQLLTPRAQMNQNMNSPRKVFIPINAPNTIRAGQTIMIKSQGPRGPRGSMIRMSQAPVRMGRAPGLGQRHPAPLPEAPKQPQPNNWKALPPEPDLKISKVENGIVISWKIEGYQEDSYEEIASYQLYAYQETSTPPNTLLWKKIGDVKALPLPMACTLTQFMAGFKYYFAVRAVDIRSRIGPFSLPGSILLLNK